MFFQKYAYYCRITLFSITVNNLYIWLIKHLGNNKIKAGLYFFVASRIARCDVA